nr:hypothetical protein [Alphaproteobacteria bacterium]
TPCNPQNLIYPAISRGYLSRFCEKYLQENYSLYFKEMMSINSGGSWLLILNKQKKEKVRSEDDDT